MNKSAYDKATPFCPPRTLATEPKILAQPKLYKTGSSLQNGRFRLLLMCLVCGTVFVAGKSEEKPCFATETDEESISGVTNGNRQQCRCVGIDPF